MRTERIQALDVLRGVAILGTLGTNIWIFTSPDGAAGFLDLPTPDSAAGFTELLLRFLSNGKFLALLSLMFGIGLELQYRSARRRGARWPGWYLWRAALLFVEGTLHYILIFEFDVLMYYAIVSVLVAFLVGRSDRVRRTWLVVQAAIHLGLVGLLTAAMLGGTGTLSGGTPAAGTGNWFAQVADRISMAAVYRSEVVLVLPLSTVLFLLGVELLRAGALEDSARGHRLRTKLSGFGLGIGVPLNLFTTFGGQGLFVLDRYLAAPVVALGLLGLITTLVLRTRGEPGPLRRGLTAVGRAALSGYIFQNLAAGVLCYGWGLGLAATFADARPWWVIVVYIGLCGLLMTLSTLWLRRFSRGPVELAWQWAYQAPQRSLSKVP
ncbi:DUF418 domain-containing protein [Amycolatopsis nigrescens]|uniref:DUF418 domain-containing protein n=1 Tax=Amycolatopsis nigrescens TaxID=381445 RepID=UPI0003A54C99|nr:DUF418 domain-containing protein [Amycolatopsis nigrescens]